METPEHKGLLSRGEGARARGLGRGGGLLAAGARVLGRHEQGSLAPVEAEEKRGGGCGIGWIEGRRKVAVVGSMWNSRRILERVAAVDREWRMG